MRQSTEFQPFIGQRPIGEIALNPQSRFELIPILAGLQQVYQNAALLSRLLSLVAADVLAEADGECGREGMSLWQIVVLAVIRQGCNHDYAALEHMANHDALVRDFLEVGGISEWSFGESTIHENISRLKARTLEEIAYAVAQEGHRLDPTARETVRSDTFVTETNIHYPTDANLMLDGIRKLTRLCGELASKLGFRGWRQAKHLFKKAKKLEREIARTGQSRQKGRAEKLKRQYQELIDRAQEIGQRALSLYVATYPLSNEDWVDRQREKILSFIVKTDHVTKVGERRVIHGEAVPNKEKLFSLFEPHTELINRGKQPDPIEFGHRVFLAEDAAGFIVDIQVMEGCEDADVLIPAIRRIQERLSNEVRQASFDRGFWSEANDAALKGAVETACLPRKGKPKAEEATEGFVKARANHAGVESKIGAFQATNGQARCRDRGITGYRRYVMLGALAQNLQSLGTLVLSRERLKKKAA